MAAVGLIHMACYCGTQLLYLGDELDGSAPVELADQLAHIMVGQDYGFFTSADGRYAECPNCGTLFELPPSTLVNRLPQMSRAQILELLRREYGIGRQREQRRSPDGLLPGGGLP
jgi:hypothetical protein